MSDTIKLGIIGVGQIGKSHIGRYKEIPGAEIVAVADVNEAEARRVAQANGIPNVFTQFRELLKIEEIQAVDVCLHNNFHAPVTIAALEAGKDVYCEKPMAGAYADALAMRQTAEKLGRKLSIQLSTLFSKETRAAKRLIDDGELGKLYYARSVGFRRRGRCFVDGYGTPAFVQKDNSAGGALYDMGVYHLARMLYLLGCPEVKTITGATFQEIPMYEDRRESSGFNVEELGIGMVRLDGGILMDIEESWAIHYEGSESSKVLGAKGGVKLDPLTFFTTVADMEMNATFDLGSADTRWHRCLENMDAYDSPQHHWIAAQQGRVPLMDTAGYALATMLISEGIYLSNQLGREVTADEVRQMSKSTAIQGL
jgi:predicted dehydrogenase